MRQPRSGGPEHLIRAVALLCLVGAVGLKESDLTSFNYRLAQAAQALNEGAIDGFFQVGAPPVPGIAELAGAKPIRLLPIPSSTAEALRHQHRLFADSAIPGGIYPGDAAAEDTPTLAVHA